VKSGQAYDVPAISQVLDLLHIMDYDYHGGWEEFTGIANKVKNSY